MQLAKTISTELDKLKRLLIKVTRYGFNDTQTPIQATPYGLDSNPIKGMVAVFSQTGEKGKPVILGYLNPTSLAKVGEFRMYSTDLSGALQFYILLTNTGKCEIGGKTNNLVKWFPLSDNLNTMVSLINQNLGAILINLQQLNIAINALAPGSVTTPYVETTVELDISTAKTDKITVE